MAWIQENLPADARFLVEGYGIYGGTTIVGADSGWWIPLLAHRQNTIPPQYALLNETPIQPDYSKRMVGLVKKLGTFSVASPDGYLLLCDEDISYIFIGQGQGKIGFNSTQLFSPEELLDNENFTLRYHQDRVYIFSLNNGICP
jgi:hypothetical protein